MLGSTGQPYGRVVSRRGRRSRHHGEELPTPWRTPSPPRSRPEDVSPTCRSSRITSMNPMTRPVHASGGTDRQLEIRREDQSVEDHFERKWVWSGRPSTNAVEPTESNVGIALCQISTDLLFLAKDPGALRQWVAAPIRSTLPDTGRYVARRAQSAAREDPSRAQRHQCRKRPD